VNVFKIPQPDSCFSATAVKELAEDVIWQFPLPGTLSSGDYLVGTSSRW